MVHRMKLIIAVRRSCLTRSLRSACRGQLTCRLLRDHRFRNACGASSVYPLTDTNQRPRRRTGRSAGKGKATKTKRTARHFEKTHRHNGRGACPDEEIPGATMVSQVAVGAIDQLEVHTRDRDDRDDTHDAHATHDAHDAHKARDTTRRDTHDAHVTHTHHARPRKHTHARHTQSSGQEQFWVRKCQKQMTTNKMIVFVFFFCFLFSCFFIVPFFLARCFVMFLSSWFSVIFSFVFMISKRLLEIRLSKTKLVWTAIYHSSSCLLCRFCATTGLLASRFLYKNLNRSLGKVRDCCSFCKHLFECWRRLHIKTALQKKDLRHKSVMAWYIRPSRSKRRTAHAGGASCVERCKKLLASSSAPGTSLGSFQFPEKFLFYMDMIVSTV